MRRWFVFLAVFVFCPAGHAYETEGRRKSEHIEDLRIEPNKRLFESARAALIKIGKQNQSQRPFTCSSFENTHERFKSMADALVKKPHIDTVVPDTFVKAVTAPALLDDTNSCDGTVAAIKKVFKKAELENKYQYKAFFKHFKPAYEIAKDLTPSLKLARASSVERLTTNCQAWIKSARDALGGFQLSTERLSKQMKVHSTALKEERDSVLKRFRCGAAGRASSSTITDPRARQAPSRVVPRDR